MKENVLMSIKGPSAGNVLLKYLPIFVFESAFSRTCKQEIILPIKQIK
jgi:hypothetical protein